MKVKKTFLSINSYILFFSVNIKYSLNANKILRNGGTDVDTSQGKRMLLTYIFAAFQTFIVIYIYIYIYIYKYIHIYVYTFLYQKAALFAVLTLFPFYFRHT